MNKLNTSSAIECFFSYVDGYGAMLLHCKSPHVKKPMVCSRENCPLPVLITSPWGDKDPGCRWCGEDLVNGKCLACSDGPNGPTHGLPELRKKKLAVDDETEQIGDPLWALRVRNRMAKRRRLPGLGRRKK